MADALSLADVRVERVGDDVLVTGIPSRRGPRGLLAKNPPRG
jgi:diaminohydroxyphosphoribosylaminopyrimidine deaminase/5-amino-6-(5-phosphoribosylamino)uracil reductase